MRSSLSENKVSGSSLSKEDSSSYFSSSFAILSLLIFAGNDLQSTRAIV
jgi:hypothetical protein